MKVPTAGAVQSNGWQSVTRQGRYIDGEGGASFSLPIAFPSAVLFAVSTDCGSGALSTATAVSKSTATVYHSYTISGSLLAVGY